MEFTLDNKQMFSHLVLNDTELARTIASTPKWTNDGILEARLEINGIAVPAESLDALLNEMWEQAQVESGKEAFEKAVEAKAREILKEQKNDVWNSMTELQNKMEYLEDLIKFPWEESNNE